LGGCPVTVQARDTQLVAGELLRDAARTFGSYADVLVLRTFAQQTVDEVARHAGIPVINGLSDLDHPCQVLADLFTVFERRPEPFQLRWAFVGDTPHMVNGYVAASALLGFELRLGLPSGTDVEAATWARAERLGARVQRFRSPLEAAEGAHVVSTGPWPATFTTHPEASVFQVNATMLAGTAEAFVLHRLPAQRGVEITDDVLEGRHSLAFEAAANRLPVQQALLEWLLDVPVF
ncbi:MAG: ornithine carbamoyltransferase, partial [Myxococcota bacterium]